MSVRLTPGSKLSWNRWREIGKTACYWWGASVTTTMGHRPTKQRHDGGATPAIRRSAIGGRTPRWLLPALWSVSCSMLLQPLMTTTMTNGVPTFWTTIERTKLTRWWLRLRRLLCLRQHVTTTRQKSAFWGIFDSTATLPLTFWP